jgi:hypothetical protein
MPRCCPGERNPNYGKFDYVLWIRDASHPDSSSSNAVIGEQRNAELCQRAFGLVRPPGDWLSIELEG